MLLPGETVPVAALSAIGMLLLALASVFVWLEHVRDERRFSQAVGRVRRAGQRREARSGFLHWPEWASHAPSEAVAVGVTGGVIAVALFLAADLAVRLTSHTDLTTMVIGPLEKFLQTKL
jgi:hypothetical protein